MEVLVLVDQKHQIYTINGAKTVTLHQVWLSLLGFIYLVLCVVAYFYWSLAPLSVLPVMYSGASPSVLLWHEQEAGWGSSGQEETFRWRRKRTRPAAWQRWAASGTTQTAPQAPWVPPGWTSTTSVLTAGEIIFWMIDESSYIGQQRHRINCFYCVQLSLPVPAGSVWRVLRWRNTLSSA